MVVSLTVEDSRSKLDTRDTIGLLSDWRSTRNTEISTCQYTTLKRDRGCCARQDSNPQPPKSEWPQTHATDNTRPPGPAQIEMLGAKKKKNFPEFNFSLSKTESHVFTRVRSYLTGNTLRSGYKDKSVNAVVKIGNYRARHKEDIHTLRGGKYTIY